MRYRAPARLRELGITPRSSPTSQRRVWSPPHSGGLPGTGNGSAVPLPWRQAVGVRTSMGRRHIHRWGLEAMTQTKPSPFHQDGDGELYTRDCTRGNIIGLCDPCGDIRFFHPFKAVEPGPAPAARKPTYRVGPDGTRLLGWRIAA